ncbi:MAG: HEAT repeat domain-containing protein [Tepidisphaerales bacterium]
MKYQIADFKFQISNLKISNFKSRIPFFLFSFSFFLGLTLSGTAQDKTDALLKTLKDPASEIKAKFDACRELATFGDKRAVPVLAALLPDEKMSHMARYALEPIPDASVDAALRDALPKCSGKPLIGVINSIGVRRDAQAVDALAGLLKNAEPAIAGAAAYALGKIGTEPAAKALEAAGNSPSVLEASVICAENLAKAGQTKSAIAIYDRVRATQAPFVTRSAALRGAILTRGNDGIPILVESLNSADGYAYATALRVGIELPGEAATKALVGELPKLSTDRQAQMIPSLSRRHDAAAMPALLPLAKAGPKPVRLAAIAALPEMGQASAVPVLVDNFADADKDIVAASQNALAAIGVKEADDAVMAMLASADNFRRLDGITMVARRRLTSAVPELLKLSSDANADIRLAAVKQLGDLAGENDIPAFLDLLAKAKDQQEMRTAEQTLSTVAARTSNADATAEKLAAAMAKAEPAQKQAILRVLRAVGGAKALAAVRDSIKDPNEPVRAAAIRVLAEWPTIDAAKDLLDLAKSSANDSDKLLCLRGALSAAANAKLPAAERFDVCKQASTMIQRDDERRLLLAALSEIGRPESLAMAMSLADTATIREEAYAAAVTAADRLNKERGTNAAGRNAAIKVLDQVTASSTNARTKERAATAKKDIESKLAPK